MKNLNVKAFRDFGRYINELQTAINQDDVQKQMVALTQAIDALQDAKKTMVGSSGGFLN